MYCFLFSLSETPTPAPTLTSPEGLPAPPSSTHHLTPYPRLHFTYDSGTVLPLPFYPVSSHPNADPLLSSLSNTLTNIRVAMHMGKSKNLISIPVILIRHIHPIDLDSHHPRPMYLGEVVNWSRVNLADVKYFKKKDKWRLLGYSDSVWERRR
ncbi:hypothetical protein BDP27DRAFT_530589 [Rhodocollybia butyracea]|uniref:Uncharacterized protein n=1 Tax=Rhodocollybia butyracea TaxID=206335 RepID=A0A9P5P4Z5_9AGAR|nr:hypothetical protein BDP27DRAFT_530589 [Rhodocollybia butyracea]